MNSLLLIDKPSGITSFDVIRRLREKIGISKIGHAGVLDKLASGLLICATGKATKLLSIFEESYKIYISEFTFGIQTDTFDILGRTLKKGNSHVSRNDLINVLDRFKGNVYQIPPPFSNVKYKGKRLYKYALSGQEVRVKSRKVFIYDIKLLDFYNGKALLKIKCSKGTYIRSLANDIGIALNTFGIVSSLRRIYIHPFDVSLANSLDDPKPLSIGRALGFLDEIVLDDNFIPYIKNGVLPCRYLNCTKLDKALYKIVDSNSKVIAVIQKSKTASYLYKAIFI